MKKTIITFLVLICATIVHSQEKSQEEEIKNTIAIFFDGLYKGDSAIIKQTLHPEIKIQTTYTDKTGDKILVTETKEALFLAVSKKKPSDIYEEKLLSYDINIDGNLASVWTPYEFYINGDFSHCGANSFQLFHNGNEWEIIYLVDMRRRGNCDAIENNKE